MTRTNSIRTKQNEFSDLALEKLEGSGVWNCTANAAGLFSVENARLELSPEFASRPALVFPYFDLSGDLAYFMSEGERSLYFRIRYLGEPKVRGFFDQKPQRYAQLKGSGTRPYFPPLCDWKEISEDASQAVLITEGELKALKACQHDLPTIGLGGVYSFLGKRVVPQ